MIPRRTSVRLVLFLFMLISSAHQVDAQPKNPPQVVIIISRATRDSLKREWSEATEDKDREGCYNFLDSKGVFTEEGDVYILAFWKDQLAFWEDQIWTYRFKVLGLEQTIERIHLIVDSYRGGEQCVKALKDYSAAEWMLMDTETLEKLRVFKLMTPTAEKLLGRREKFPAGIYLLGKFTSNFSLMDLSECLYESGKKKCHSMALEEAEAKALMKHIELVKVVSSSMMAQLPEVALKKIKEELGKISSQRPDLCVQLVGEKPVKIQHLEIEGEEKLLSTYVAFIRLDLLLRSLRAEVPGFQTDHDGDGFNPNPKEGKGIQPGLKQWAEVVKEIDSLACNGVGEKVVVIGHSDSSPYYVEQFEQSGTYQRLDKKLITELNSWLAYYRGVVGMYELLCNSFLEKPKDQLEQTCNKYKGELENALRKWKGRGYIRERRILDEIRTLFPSELKPARKIKLSNDQGNGREIGIHRAEAPGRGKEPVKEPAPTLTRSVELCLPDLWGFLTKDEKNFHSEGCKQEGERAFQAKR